MDELYRLVEQEKIHLYYRDMTTAPVRIYGLYFFDLRRQRAFIVLESSLVHNIPMHRSVLAEELGHHFTVPEGNLILPYTSYSNIMLLNKDEARALRWACDFLMPVDKVKEAIEEGANTIDGIAERFNVAPWLVRKGFVLRYACHIR